MLENTTLKYKIIELIKLKQEGAYWDFKKQWHVKENNYKLLHDIICMANNLTNHDGLIIIGVDEEKDYKIVGVEEDKNRKNTQNLVDFLRAKKFSGEIRPTVVVEELIIYGKTIDVIIVKNDKHAPYYLKESYGEAKSNFIYTRIQDTNTPINESADRNKVEYLWKKNFGLTSSILERLEIYLEDYGNWIDSPYGEMDKYYNLYPEFTIEYVSAKDERKGYEFYLFTQKDTTPYWYDIKFKYHQTILKEIGGVNLDGCRYFTPCPEKDGIILNETDSCHWDITYRYFTKGTFLYKAHQFFHLQEDCRGRDSKYMFLQVVLIFESEDERMKFTEFAKINWNRRDEYLNEKDIPKMRDLPEKLDKEHFQKQYADALVLQKMLKEFRENLSRI